jgi:ribonuclease HI
MDVKIYCDGSCLGNGKVENFGGYGVVIVVDGEVFRTYKKGARNTTNNRMELEGLLASVKFAKFLDRKVEIYCDSAYCINTVNDWMYKWAANGWKKADKKTPENLDIISQLFDLLNFNTLIKFVKVKGHADNEFNNEADRLAVAASAEEQANYLQSLKGGN